MTGTVSGQAWSIGQVVKTATGSISGHASDWRPEVSEYLGIPFAEPPVGDLRFAPPKPLAKSDKAITATSFGPSCPENVGGAAATMTDAGEDCLSLNVWTKPQTGEKSKAVMIWIYGGGYGSGKTSNPLYNGACLADENDVVTVSMNYRLNIYGFPRAPFLSEKNPGLLDQRVAVEWVRDNIAGFGGDPKRMILFGQSAGGGSVDMYSFAYAHDPIVYGLIPQSGCATNPAVPVPLETLSAGWWGSSRSLGCGGEEAGEATITGVRSKSWQEVTDTVPRRGVIANIGSGGFGPTVDGKVVFPDYNRRRDEGAFAKIPLLVGNTNYERGLYETLAQARGETVPDDFRPPARDGVGPHAAALARRKAGVNTWRYVYTGTWGDDTAPGAGHGSEIGLVLGTNDHPTRRLTRNLTPEEAELSVALRQAWTAFAKDPVNGLNKLGWPMYDEKSADPILIRLGGKDSAQIAFEPRSKYDKGW